MRGPTGGTNDRTPSGVESGVRACNGRSRGGDYPRWIGRGSRAFDPRHRARDDSHSDTAAHITDAHGDPVGLGHPDSQAHSSYQPDDDDAGSDGNESTDQTHVVNAESGPGDGLMSGEGCSGAKCLTI